MTPTFEVQNFSKGTMNGKPIVPICSVCNKVRDLNDKWHEISIPDTVAISHSYCPRCADAMLSEIAQYQLEK